MLEQQAAADWTLHRCGSSVSSCGQLGTASKDTGQDDPDCSNEIVCLPDIKINADTHEFIFTLL